MAKRKQIGHGDMTGDAGIALIHRVVNKMGFVWNALHLEAGIDGLIEVRDPDNAEVSNCIIQIQSKAGDSYFKAEDDSSFEFLCKERDLDYWMRGNAPVVLVVSRPRNDEAYWVSIKDYFGDPKRRKERKITFDKKQDRFDTDCRDKLATLALPADSGLYLPAIPEEEELVCNLLPVSSYPKRLFRSSTKLRFPRQVWEQLNRGGQFDHPEWFLHNGFIYSFHDLTFSPWKRVCLSSATENLATDDWALSNDRQRRYVFIRLFRACVDKLLSGQGVKFHKDRGHHYFRATTDLSIRKIDKLTVFKGYESKTVEDRIAYYRHRAVTLRYLRFDEQWYVEITPTYHFTSNGWKLSRYFEQRLKGIKQLERQNSGHLRQVRLWSEVLRQVHIASGNAAQHQKSLFGDDRLPVPEIEFYDLIGFDPLPRFTVENAVPEKVWLPAQPADESDNQDSAQMELFD